LKGKIVAKESGARRKLFEELAKGNELTVSLTRISAKGGFAVFLAFILATLLFVSIIV
jgi:hypothetical protein